MVRYAHTNLIARDWDALARFYERVFGCARLQPERDHRGEWIEKDGSNKAGGERPLHREGFGHLAFTVDDVESMLAKVLAEGGTRLGDKVTREIPGAGVIELVYVRDPEGNPLGLQRWLQV